MDVTILGVLGSWDPIWRSTIQIGAIDTSKHQIIGKRVQPDEFGYFTLVLPESVDLEKRLVAGDVAIAAYRDKLTLVGLRTIKLDKLRASVTIRLPLLVPRHTAAAAMVPASAIRNLAARVGNLNGVPQTEARAPKPLMQAIRELNSMTLLAASAATGSLDAMKEFRDVLDAHAAYHPGGAAASFTLGGPDGFNAPGASALSDPLAQTSLSKPCGPTVDIAINTIQAGLVLDLTTGRNDGFYVRQARAFVQTRVRSVVAYGKSVARGLSGDGRAGIPGMDDGITDPILDGDPFSSGEPPLDQPPGLDPGDPDGILGSDFCQQVLELCMALYESSAAASEGDTLLDLIGSVNPSCQCYGQFNPNQIYTATPSANRDFTVAISGGRLRPDVLLYFRNNPSFRSQ